MKNLIICSARDGKLIKGSTLEKIKINSYEWEYIFSEYEFHPCLSVFICGLFIADLSSDVLVSFLFLQFAPLPLSHDAASDCPADFPDYPTLSLFPLDTFH